MLVPESSGHVGPDSSGHVGPESSGHIGPDSSGHVGPDSSGHVGPDSSMDGSSTHWTVLGRRSCSLISLHHPVF